MILIYVKLMNFDYVIYKGFSLLFNQIKFQIFIF